MTAPPPPPSLGREAGDRPPGRHNAAYGVAVGFSLSAIDSSPDGDHVVVAGGEVFKLLDVRDYTRCREAANLRLTPKHLFHLSDAKWNPLHASKIATATLNTQVVLWDLQKRGSKFQVAYDEHQRTVNRVCWAPQDACALLSGAQDGLVKLWDTRCPASAATFRDTSAGAPPGDTVRDVCFSPFMTDTFAAGMDSGAVKVWDLRHPQAPRHRIAAHSNGAPVCTLSWHPTQRELLASGSNRDETVLVWDLTRLSEGSRFAVQTLGPVAVVRWRPVRSERENAGELATAAASRHHPDAAVWDVFRPHLPVTTLPGHTREVTGLAWWRGGRDVLLSVSKDGCLRASPIRIKPYLETKRKREEDAFNSCSTFEENPL